MWKKGREEEARTVPDTCNKHVQNSVGPGTSIQGMTRQSHNVSFYTLCSMRGPRCSRCLFVSISCVLNCTVLSRKKVMSQYPVSFIQIAMFDILHFCSVKETLNSTSSQSCSHLSLTHQPQEKKDGRSFTKCEAIIQILFNLIKQFINKLQVRSCYISFMIWIQCTVMFRHKYEFYMKFTTLLYVPNFMKTATTFNNSTAHTFYLGYKK